ncbi:Hypothetical predicted protein [Pelobates cultripes]|uniref:Uncharacterized protein n=1 Tax=Pelobates cultripes TaxID=61616 RepID=A0AAD1WX20_PELCU|nr:Hypothetical predicted protein [Pelobates cultripes]
MPKSSSTRDPKEQIIAKAQGGRNIAPRSFPPSIPGPAVKRATFAQGPTLHSPATQLAPPRPSRQPNQATDAELSAGSDTNPRTIGSGRLPNERLIPRRIWQGPHRTAWMARMPALMDARSPLQRTSRADFPVENQLSHSTSPSLYRPHTGESKQ